jgi:AraC-like DNA-binding protein
MPNPGQDMYNTAMPDITPPVPPLNDASQQLYVRLFRCEHRSIGKDWTGTATGDGFWRLYVNNRDGATVRTTGPWHRVEPGSVYLLPAWLAFDYRCRHVVGHYYIHFDLVGLPGSLSRELFNDVICLKLTPVLRSAAKQAIDACQPTRLSDVTATCAAKALCFLVMAQLLGELPAEQRTRFAQLARPDHAIGPALRLIDEQFDRELAIAELADACHLSSDHFIRRFREAVGQTPGQYLTERRIAAASQQLLFTDHSIDQIAEACGFANRFYFSRVFSRHMNTPPAAYRRAMVV